MKSSGYYVRLLVCSFLLFSIIAVCSKVAAINSAPDSMVIKRCQDFKITGDGRSQNWQSAEWVTLAQQGENFPKNVTRVKVLYSGTGIYFLFYCGDEKLTTTMAADNMDLWKEDVVEVFLWTSEDFPVYFEYEISPMNFELPIMVPNYKGTFLGWLPWHYEGDRKIQHETSAVGGEKKSGSTVSAWIAEFYIPFKVLAPLNQVPPVSGTKWRANMYRMDYDHETVRYMWQKINKTFHDYNNFGTFVFE